MHIRRSLIALLRTSPLVALLIAAAVYAVSLSFTGSPIPRSHLLGSWWGKGLFLLAGFPIAIAVCNAAMTGMGLPALMGMLRQPRRIGWALVAYIAAIAAMSAASMLSVKVLGPLLPKGLGLVLGAVGGGFITAFLLTLPLMLIAMRTALLVPQALSGKSFSVADAWRAGRRRTLSMVFAVVIFFLLTRVVPFAAMLMEPGIGKFLGFKGMVLADEVFRYLYVALMAGVVGCVYADHAQASAEDSDSAMG